MIGSTLRLRYTLNSLLAEGPIFTVIAGRDVLLNRDATVRLLRPPCSKEPEFLKALQIAIERLKQVQHPQIEALWDLDDVDDTPFIVGEASKGQFLTDRIKKLAPFSAQVAIGMTISALQGLEALHEEGIVHGDIGPHNMTVLPDGNARLAMAGIWETYRSSQVAGALALSQMAPYMAPDIGSGAMPSVHGDCYAMGVVLFQLLTGRLPFIADNAISMSLKHASDPVPSLLSINPSMPTVLDHIVKKSLTKDPAGRYQSAAEFCSDLRVLQDAMRFGRTLTWPIKTGAISTEQTQIAPAMNVARENIKEKSEPEAYQGDVPRWLIGTVIATALLTACFVGFWFISTLNRPDLVTVPKLQNMSLNEARNLLRSLKLGYRVVRRVPNDKVAADSVVDIYPSPGQKVRENTQVGLELSSGSLYVETPDLHGRTLDTARSMLGSLDLQLDSRTDEVKSNLDKGFIVTQTPAAGKKVQKATRIKVSVSVGPEEKPADDAPPAGKYVYTLSIKLTDVTEDVTVRVEMDDDDGNRVIHDELHKPGDTINLKASGTGDHASFQIYYDNELVKQVDKDADEQPKP